MFEGTKLGGLGAILAKKKTPKTVNIADSKILIVQTFKEMAFHLISASSEVGWNLVLHCDLRTF